MDTDILIMMMRGTKINRAKTDAQRMLASQSARIIQTCREKARQGHRLAISAITLAELDFGARKSRQYDQETALLHRVLAPFDQLDFRADACARPYGLLRYQLTAIGRLVGANDMLIAAHAISLDATLVTNNTQEFTRIPELKVENWSFAPA